MERLFDYEFWGYGTSSIKQNMAMDEYLLARAEKKKKATIRFWNVKKDGVVLGYAESGSAIKEKDKTFDIARRITGGSHVEFDENCLAYSFTIPRDAKFIHFDEMRNYFASKIEESLVELGIETIKTDNKASTINIKGKVVASHAIFWGIKSALMHGLVIIDPYDVDKIARRMILGERKIGKNLYTEYEALKQIPALSGIVKEKDEYLNKILRREHVKKILSKKILEKIAGSVYDKKRTNQAVSGEAQKILGTRHLGESWLEERNPPYTEKEVETIPGEELNGDLKSGLGYCMYIQVPDKDFAKMAEPSD